MQVGRIQGSYITTTWLMEDQARPQDFHQEMFISDTRDGEVRLQVPRDITEGQGKSLCVSSRYDNGDIAQWKISSSVIFLTRAIPRLLPFFFSLSLLMKRSTWI